MFNKTLQGLSQVQELATTVSNQLVEIGKQNSKVVEDAKTAASDVAKVAAAGRAGVEQDLSGMLSRTSEITRQAKDEVASFLHDLRNKTREEAADAFDDLLLLVSGSTSQWAKELQEGLDALMSTGDFRAFLRQYGDIVNEEGERIRDMLAGIDPNQFREKLQQLAQFIDDEGNSISDIVEALENQLEGRFDNIATLLQKFDEKKVTFEELRRQLLDLVDAFGTAGELDEIVNELLDRLQEENRR